MSVGEQLFVRGMEVDDEDIWDDTQLIKAYEKALKSYKPTEMAKRIAMETNAKSKGEAKPNWRKGSACRAVYKDDGQEYEANIVEVLDNQQFLIKFVGYEDKAVVRLEDLAPSRGAEARAEQQLNVTMEPSWKDIVKSQLSIENSVLDSASEVELVKNEPKHDIQEPSSSRLSDSSKSRKNKKHKRKRYNTPPAAHLADPAQPPFNFMQNFGGDFPDFDVLPPLPPVLPPLPPVLPSGDIPNEEHEILNSMLTSWYMSGYYAALYNMCVKKKSKSQHN